MKLRIQVPAKNEVVAGSVILIGDDPYIVARVGRSSYRLIGLAHGNRWTREPFNQLTQDAILQHVDGPEVTFLGRLDVEILRG